MADHILPLPEEVDILLARAFWPDASPEDVDALGAWVGEDPERALLVARMREVRQTLPAKAVERRADAAWERARVRLALPSTDMEQTHALRSTFKGMRVPEGRTRGRGGWYVLLAVAASIVMFLVGRGAFRSPLPLPPSLVTTYVTHNGERADVRLPDGSRAILSVASRLEVPADFAVGNREVRLTGEALFVVTHHTGKPFTVVAGGAATRVLGTSFVVRHYSTDSSVTVAVREGRVAVRDVAIAAHQEADVSAGGAIRLRQADSTEFSFERGILTLNWISLAEAIGELDRWYDVDIRLADASLGTRHLQASFTPGSLGNLSSILSYTLDVRVVRSGRTLTLYPR